MRMEARASGEPFFNGAGCFRGEAVITTVASVSVLAGEDEDVGAGDAAGFDVVGDGGRLVSIGVNVRTIGFNGTERCRRCALVIRRRSCSVTPCAFNDSSHSDGRPSRSGVTCSSC